MAAKVMQAFRLRSWQLQGASMGSIVLCLALWIRAKTVDQEHRGNAERRAMFVGLWPSVLWQLGEELERHEQTRRFSWRSGAAGGRLRPGRA